VYEGAIAHEDVRAYVESSDCLVLLGAPLSDIDLMRLGFPSFRVVCPRNLRVFVPPW